VAFVVLDDSSCRTLSGIMLDWHTEPGYGFTNNTTNFANLAKLAVVVMQMFLTLV